MGHRQSLFLVHSRNQADALLQQAETMDGYLAACVGANQAARHGSYHANVIPPHLLEELDTTLSSLRLPRRLQDLGEVPIVHLMPSADDGMPHSRPGIVCVPHLELIHSTETMIHELWHVHQRRYQKEWLLVFQALGWRPWDGELPAGLEMHRRINPDTVDSPLWIFENTWVAVPLFRDVVHPRLRDVDIWYYHVHEGHRTRTTPAGLMDWFPSLPASAYEHPRELAAYALASPEKYQDTKGFIELIAHLGQGAIV